MKKTYKTPFKEMTYIWWQDAYVTTDDKPTLEDKDNLTISYGVKIKDDDEFVYLSHYYCGITKLFASPFTAVPKGMIKHIKTVKVK